MFELLRSRLLPHHPELRHCEPAHRNFRPGDVLHSQANLLRMQRSARAENAAAVASVRILVPSLLILMGVVVAVFSPMILRIIREGLF